MMRWLGGLTAIDPALTARFSGDCARLNPAEAPIGLAVSGGPDSLAMLLLAHEAMPGGFAVATVNHGLRAEAGSECALVERTCAARGIVCDTLSVTVPPGNVQSAARAARYGALAGWAQTRGLAAIATAHHADDQAETLLMRLNRGSGVAGLAGVRERGMVAGVAVIRPLLHWRRAELAEVLTAHGIAGAADPSNADPRFDRVRIRQALAGADWIDPLALAHSAAALNDAYTAIEAYADLLWPQHVRQEGEGYVLGPCSPREMNRRLIARVMELLGGRPRGGDVARLLARLEAGEGGNVAGVLAVVRADGWHFSPEPLRRA